MAMAMQMTDYINIFCQSPSLQQTTDVQIMSVLVQEPPKADIVEEPCTPFRFRYESEQGAHGSIMGVNNNNNNGGGSPRQRRSYPKVQILNYSDPVTLRVSLYTTNDATTTQLHVNELQDLGNTLQNGVYTCDVANPQNTVIEIPGIHIKHIGHKNIKQALQRRYERDYPGMSKQQIATKAKHDEKAMKKCMNAVSFRFEFYDTGGNLLCHTYSQIVKNQKSPCVLKICEMSKKEGSSRGNEQMIILCEKVDKKDIEVHFFEQSGWSQKAGFTEIGVWHQVAISFQTPPYHTIDIDQPVKVHVKLVQPSDGEESKALEFHYLPNVDQGYVNCKRKRTEVPDDAMSQIQDLNRPSTSRVTNLTHPNIAPYSVGQISEVSQHCNLQGDFTAVSMEDSQNHAVDNFPELSPAEILKDFDIPVIEDHTYLTSSSNDPVLTQSALPETEPTSYQYILELEALIGEEPAYLMENISEPMDDVEADSPARVESDATLASPESTLIPRSSFSEKTSRKVQTLADSSSEIKKTEIKKTVGDKIVSGYQIVYNLAVKTAEQLQNYAKTSNVKYLLKSMSHLIAIQDENGDNAIHNAVIHANEDSTALFNLVEAIDQTSEETPLNIFNNLVQTPMHIAIHVNNAKMVQVLLEHGANPNFLDRHGNSALHLASHHGKEELVKILVNKDLYTKASQDNYPKLNQLNYNGYTALHLATQAKSLACVRLLCLAGADINVEDGTCGRSAIYTAVEFRNEEILKELLNQQDVDVNMQTFSGYTPLHLACSAGNADMVRLLLDAKADPAIESNKTRNEESSEEEEVSVKMENADEDEDDDDEEEEEDIHGYSSFDLTNNAEILKLLHNATKKKQMPLQKETGNVEFQTSSIGGALKKEEDSRKPCKYDDSGMIDDYDDDSVSPFKPEETPKSKVESEKFSFGDSGLGFQTSELDSMKQHIKDRLSSLLDPPGPNDWTYLAKHLDLDCMNDILASAESPTIALLSYIPSVKILCDGLDAMGSQEALKIVEKYYIEELNSKTTDVEGALHQIKNLSLT